MSTKNRLSVLAAFCCTVVLVFAGCASPGGGGTAASPQGVTSLPSLSRMTASVTNVAGRYQGKFYLKSKLIGSVYFNLSQSGTAVGGILRLVLSNRTLREPAALTLDPTKNTLAGVAVDASGKTPCTYALKVSYNPKTYAFNGTSSPLACTGGKVANFKTTESCFYNIASGTNGIRNDAKGIIEC